MAVFQSTVLKFCFLLSRKGTSGHRAARMQAELPHLHRWLWGYLGRSEGVRDPTATVGRIKLGKATDGEPGSPSSSLRGLSFLSQNHSDLWIYGI